MTAIIAMATAKSGRPIPAYRRRLGVAAIVLASAMMFSSNKTLADESGVSFWVPGFLWQPRGRAPSGAGMVRGHHLLA